MRATEHWAGRIYQGREGGAGGMGQSLGLAGMGVGWERGACGPAPEEEDIETPQERQPLPPCRSSSCRASGRWWEAGSRGEPGAPPGTGLYGWEEASRKEEASGPRGVGEDLGLRRVREDMTVRGSGRTRP